MQSMLFFLATVAIGRVQNILGDSRDLAWYPIEAGKVVDIDQHQALRRFEHIHSIEVQPEYLSHTLRQLEHLARYRDLLLHHPAMQGRTFGDRTHLLAC